MIKRVLCAAMIGLSINGYAEMCSENTYGVVLAGGVGERLWPLSRATCPKQFLTVGSQQNLLQQSLQRMDTVILPQNVWAVTAQAHASQLKSMIPSLGGMIVEPASRNTGPAILLSCLELYEKDPDALVIFFPADPYIPESDYSLFRTCLRKVFSFVEHHPELITLFGVKPTFPATGYGYIEYDEASAMHGVYMVTRFHEKPSLKLAENYIKQQNMLWNICMFAGTVKTFIQEFKAVSPDLYNEVMAFKDGKKSYESITAISVDCAVMERSNRVCVLPVDFSWCDVGNVETFLSIKYKSVAMQNVISVDAHDNLVDVPRKLVALVGVDNLCVVETADALLITKRSDAEKVRGVVRQLKQEQLTDYL